MFDGVGIADIPRVLPVLLDGTAVRVPVTRAARGFFDTASRNARTNSVFPCLPCIPWLVSSVCPDSKT